MKRSIYIGYFWLLLLILSCDSPTESEPEPEGCDGVSGSGLVLDECGVCDGNNSTCTDECGVVNGPGPEVACWDGALVCEQEEFTNPPENYPDWDPGNLGYLNNYPDYEFNGSVTGMVSIDDEIVGQPGDMVAVFVGEVQRGIAQATGPTPFGPYVGEYAYLIMVYSNEASGETLNFKYYLEK